jgi:predicted kinase
MTGSIFEAHDRMTRRDRSSDLSARTSAHPPIVVQMHGEPGSGKSTLAHALGEALGALVIDKDVIKAALLRSGIPEQQAAAGAYEVFFAQARAFVAAGHAVVLDNPVFWEPVERRWLEIADAAGSPRILIECVCSDRDELARRLTTREAVESQPRTPLDLARHPGATPTPFQPRLTLDTTRPLADLVDEAVSYVEHLTPQPPLHAVERGSRPPAPPTTDDRRPAPEPQRADPAPAAPREPLSTAWRGVAEGRGEVHGTPASTPPTTGPRRPTTRPR